MVSSALAKVGCNAAKSDPCLILRRGALAIAFGTGLSMDEDGPGAAAAINAADPGTGPSTSERDTVKYFLGGM